MNKFRLEIIETFLTMKAARYWRSLSAGATGARNLTGFKVKFVQLMHVVTTQVIR